MFSDQNKKSKVENYKKVKIFYTGGVIGMQKNAKGVLESKHNMLKEKIRNTPKLHNKKALEEMEESDNAPPSDSFIMIHPLERRRVMYHLEEYNPVLEASTTNSEAWIRLAKDIKGCYDSYDGFIILHGIETLTYTASALSFLLINLGKPVILTAALIPISESTSDAIDHIMASLLLAGWYKIPEVAVFFGDKLFRGNRTIKISDYAMNVFRSVNYPRLADIGSTVRVYQQNILEAASSSANNFYIQGTLSNEVIIISAYPAIKSEILRNFLKPPVKGVVLQCFGTGNITSDPDVIEVLKNAVQQKILIVSVTLGKGSSGEVDSILRKIGVVYGFDMTTEAAYTKLCCVLSKSHLLFEGRCKMMTLNTRGELSEKI